MSSWRTVRGPLTLAVTYALTLLLWGAARPLQVWFADTRTTLDALGVACGLTGATAFAANVILGGRIPILDRWFGGLEAMYRTHRANGKIAYTLILLHVALIVAGNATMSTSAALGLFSPSAGKVVWFGIVAFVGMTLAIGATLYLRLSHEVFVYVQRTFGIIFGIAAFHVLLTMGAKASSRPLTIYLWLLTALALAAFFYRSLLGDVLVRRHEYIVTTARELDPHVMEISMRPVREHISRKPGQFIFATFYSDEFEAQFHPVSVSPDRRHPSATIVLRPGDVRNQFHPFSLTSAPDDPELKLAVKAVGSFTRALHRLKPGAIARIEGPYGEFSHLNMPPGEQVWIAGGIGITPFLSMARSLEDDRYRVHLFYGVKNRAEAYFWDDLREISARVPSFEATLVPEDEEGFITAARVVGTDAASTDFLICGPPAMVEALSRGLLGAGVPDARVHGERFGFGPRSS
ncbi:MAG: hypothetical protein QOH90_1885 [Actinomycetota bacterium]|nr:hypothetical protein [Actinomycetota bacterium]